MNKKKMFFFNVGYYTNRLLIKYKKYFAGFQENKKHFNIARFFNFS